MRQIRFTDMRQVKDREAVVKIYIREAVDVEKTGMEVGYRDKEALDAPEELQRDLRKPLI